MGWIQTLSFHSQLHFHKPKHSNRPLSITSITHSYRILCLPLLRAKPLHISSKLSLSPTTSFPPLISLEKNDCLAKFLCEKLLISLIGVCLFMGSFGCNAKPSFALSAQPSESSVNVEENRDTQMGKSEEEEMYERILEEEPKNVEALKVVVHGKMREGKTKEALKYVERLIDIEPEEVEWRLLEGLCYEMMGQLSKAKRLFKQILKEKPLLLRALHGLAMVMHKNLEGPAVFEMLNKALELASHDKRVTEERNIRILIAQMHVVKGQLEEALRKFQDLINENPRDFRPYLCQGIIYSLLDKKEAAAEQFEIYQSLVPEEFPQRGFLDDVVFAAKTEDPRTFSKGI